MLWPIFDYSTARFLYFEFFAIYIKGNQEEAALGGSKGVLTFFYRKAVLGSKGIEAGSYSFLFKT